MNEITESTLISEGEPLGEIIDTLILLENYGIETDRIFTVNGKNECASTLLSMFDFKNVKLSRARGDASSAPRNKNQAALWEHFKNSSREILVPSYLYPSGLFNDNTLMQFDSRSARGQSCSDGSVKIAMKKWEIKRAVRKWGKEPMFLIGGQDTEEYMPGVALKRGRLPQLIAEMHECRFFLGACSGMAHLAGLLQKPGVVVTLFGHDGFKFFYNRIFPSIECHSRKELLPKLA